MRRMLTPMIFIALTGFVVGMGYRFYWDYASQGTLGNYLRSGVHGMGLAASGWAVHLYLSGSASSRLRTWPLLAEIAVRALIMALTVSIVAVGLQVVLYAQLYAQLHAQPLKPEWLAVDLPRIVAVAFVLSVVFGAVYEVTRLVGGRVLLNVVLGRYRHPTRERRALMFLDLAGSTPLAEAIGEVRTQELLTRFFFDIDEPIVAHGGEVHAYVGDGVIVTWPMGPAVAAARCLTCFFAIEDKLARRADSYRDTFGAVPRFRAALHAGPVVMSECGDSHRQIAYFGDTMNVTARLQEHAKAVGRALLASGDLLREAPAVSGLSIEPLGHAALRGHAAAVEVFAVERRR